MGGVYTWLSRTRSERFNLDFAAGSEAIAYALARWTEPRTRELFHDADPVARDLFWWHLAEEVEHKSVAFDVYAELDGSKLRYTRAMVISLLLLGLFTASATLTMLVSSRRILNPLSWWHLTKWAFSMVWVVFPDLAMSALPRHHPTDFTDPTFLCAWLGSFDESTKPTCPVAATADPQPEAARLAASSIGDGGSCRAASGHRGRPAAAGPHRRWRSACAARRALAAGPATIDTGRPSKLICTRSTPARLQDSGLLARGSLMPR